MTNIKTRLFLFDRIRISSYRKTNIRSLCEHLLSDINKLLVYLHKIIYLRLICYKFNLFCLVRSIHEYNNFSTVFDYFLKTSIYACYFLSVHTFMDKLSHLHAIVNVYTTSLHIYSNSLLSFYVSYHQYFFFLTFFYSSGRYVFRRYGIASLPTTINKHTVMRAPHIDKKSREQFELRTYKRIYKFPSVFSPFYSRICFSHYGSFLCDYTHQYSHIYNESI